MGGGTVSLRMPGRFSNPVLSTVEFTLSIVDGQLSTGRRVRILEIRAGYPSWVGPSAEKSKGLVIPLRREGYVSDAARCFGQMSADDGR
jgi:hypothetical protein